MTFFRSVTTGSLAGHPRSLRSWTTRIVYAAIVAISRTWNSGILPERKGKEALRHLVNHDCTEHDPAGHRIALPELFPIDAKRTSHDATTLRWPFILPWYHDASPLFTILSVTPRPCCLLVFPFPMFPPPPRQLYLSISGLQADGPWTCVFLCPSEVDVSSSSHLCLLPFLPL